MKTSSQFLLYDAQHQISCSYTTAAGLKRSFTADESPLLNNNQNVHCFCSKSKDFPLKIIFPSDSLHSAHTDIYNPELKYLNSSPFSVSTVHGTLKQAKLLSTFPIKAVVETQTWFSAVIIKLKVHFVKILLHWLFTTLEHKSILKYINNTPTHRQSVTIKLHLVAFYLINIGEQIFWYILKNVSLLTSYWQY